MLLEVLSQRECILTMPLASETERFESLEKEEGTERIQGRSNVTEELSADFDCKRNCSECFAKFKTVVPFSWFGESGELARSCPVEFACMEN
jgi:hypothetical protein